MVLSAKNICATPACPILTGTFQNNADGTTVDNSATGWYIDASKVSGAKYFAVKSHRFHAEELGGQGIWYSKIFSVTGYSDFQAAVKVTSEGDLNSSEYVSVYYRVNGGSETLIAQKTGNFGTFEFISPLLNGNNVQLIVKIYNYNNGGSQTSKYYVEQYRVYKEVGPCASSISVSASASNNGILTCTNPSLTLSASSSATGVSYSWTGPDNFTSAAQNPVVTVAGVYTVTGTSTAGSGSATITVSENRTAPDVTATGGNLSCGSSVTLQASSSTAGVTYSWSGPNSYTSTSRNPVVTTAGTYTVTVTNPANGCSKSQSVVVSSGSAISNFWVEDFTLTNGTTTDNGATGWSASTSGSGTFSVQSNEFRVSFSAGNTAEGVWTSGIIDISTKSNTVISADLKSATASTNDFFENADYINVYYKLNGGAETIFFSDIAGLNGTTTGTASTSVSSPALNGNTLQIVIRAKNSDPTERYYFDNIKLTGTSNPINLTTAVSGIVTCTSSAQITVTPGGTVSSYSWTGPNNFASTLQNPIVTEGGQYTVTATLPGGCTVSAPVIVTQNKTLPDVSATGGTLACSSSFTINANSSVANAQYAWSGPENFVSQQKNPSVSVAGTYTVTVTNPDNGCTASQSVQVTAATPVNFWLENFALTNGTTTDNGSTSWTTQSTGSGTFSVTNNEFRVGGTGTSGEGTWTSGIIDITGKTNVSVSINARSSVPGSAEMNTSGTYMDYIRFYYKLNGGQEILLGEYLGSINNNNSTNSTISKSPLSGTSLQIIIRARASGSDEFYYFDNVKVTGTDQSLVNASASVNGLLTCSTPSVTLSGSSNTTGVSYTWSGPDNFTSTAQNPAVSTPGTYTLIVSNSAGCTASAIVEVNQNKTIPDLTATGGALTCAGNITLSAASSVTGATYSWSGPNNYTSTVQNPVVSTAGTYTVAVTNPVNGCSNSQTVQVTAGTIATLWLENFSLSDGTITDNGSTSWGTQNTGSGSFAVSGNEFRVTGTGTSGEGTWTSGIIDITGKTNVSLSINARSSITGSAEMNASGTYIDYVRCYYKLNGGQEILFGEYLGDINNHSTTSSTLSTASLNGNSIQIVIRARASGSDEFYYFDNVKVTGISTGNITANATASGPITCSNSSVTLSGSSDTPGVTYSWSGPGSFSSSLQNPQVSLSGTYTLIVTNPTNNCTSTTSVSVSQNTSSPGATAGISSALTCTVSSVTITGSSPATGVSYSWSGPGNFTSSLAAPSVTQPGTYTLTVTNPANGCISTATAVVLQDIAKPGAFYTNSGWITCKRPTTSLIGSASIPDATYNWTGPNGFSSANVTVYVSVPGIYTLLVTDPENGCTSSTQTTVYQYTAPPANVTISKEGTLACNATGISLIANSSTADVTYEWSGPNGFVSSIFNPIVTEPGTYHLVAKDPSNGCTTTVSTDVTRTVEPPAGLAITNDGPLTCTKTSVLLTASSATSGVTYHWSGPAGYSSTEQNSVTSLAGIYTVTATNPDNGCSTVESMNVLQDNAVPADVTADASGILKCTHSSVTLSASTSSGSIAYNWTGPGGFTSSQQNPVVSVPGTYTLTVTSQTNGCSTTTGVTVQQNIAAPANVTVSSSGILNCISNSVTITGNSTTPGVTYNWNGPGGFTSNSAVAAINLAGTYTLTVHSNTNGCFSAKSITVNQDIIPPSNVTISSSGILTCDNEYVILTGSSSTNGVAFEWMGPDGFAYSGDVAVTTIPGIYTLTVKNSFNGCSTVSNFEVIQDIQIPVCQISSPTTSPVALSANTISALPLANISYSWSISSPHPNWVILSGENTSSLTYQAGDAGSTATITLTTVDLENGCSNTCSIDVTSAFAAFKGIQETSYVSEDNMQISVYPNPFSDKAFIEFIPLTEDEVRIEIYSLAGVLQKVVFNEKVQKHLKYKVELTGQDIQTGTYYGIIKTNNKVYSLKLMIIK